MLAVSVLLYTICKEAKMSARKEWFYASILHYKYF